MQGVFTLSQLFYRVTRFLLNCILIVLNVSELSQALADLFYRLILLYLNCLAGE